MAKSKGPEVYRGRRKRLNLLGIVFGAAAVLLLLCVVLFFGLQKYIVFGHDGLSVVLPGAVIAEDEGAPGAEAPLEQVNAELEIGEPDYSGVSAVAGEGLGDFRALFVPAEAVNRTDISAYVSLMDSYGADALVLEVKPVSGQLVWNSSSDMAAAYGTAGEVDLAALAAQLKEQDIYLIAQLSCCIDGLLAQRSPDSALTLASGAAYSDGEGAWLDPYSSTVAQYLTELCTELIDMGFDELLLKSLTMPVTDAVISYKVELSSTPSPEGAVCSLALTLSSALRGYGVPVSAILVTTSLREGLAGRSGQNVELFAKVFDRLCSATNSAWQSGVDRDSIDQYFELGSAEQRYVPICSYAPEGFPSCIVRVPEEMLPSAGDEGAE